MGRTLHSLAVVALSAASGMALCAAPLAAHDDAFAVRCAKALVCSRDRGGVQALDRAIVLCRGGRIEAVGRADELAVPEGYELYDVGASWVMPGMIDLHSHIGGAGGINDTVFQSNPGLRVSACVVPANASLQRALSAGVTTVLYIPGSGSNVGGVGVLMKTGPKTYDATVVRDVGSLKVAQGDNPTRWGYGMGRVMMNWVIRDTFRRGVAYAARWQADADVPAHERDIQFDVFRSLKAGEAQISTHTQVPQLVLATLRIAKQEFDLPVYLDHSTVGGWVYGALAEELGVPAIVGPRSVDTATRGMINWSRNRLEGFRGVAAGWQANGHTRIGFNTDAPVIPGEDLFLQAAMGARYGFDDSRLETVRGLTIVPAQAAGIDGRVGSLEPGKDADLVVMTGHPADPRNRVEMVWIDGELLYDVGREPQRY